MSAEVFAAERLTVTGSVPPHVTSTLFPQCPQSPSRGARSPRAYEHATEACRLKAAIVTAEPVMGPPFKKQVVSI
ncbi:unnamed protein product [Boreogadus saida]